MILFNAFELYSLCNPDDLKEKFIIIKFAITLLLLLSLSSCETEKKDDSSHLSDHVPISDHIPVLDSRFQKKNIDDYPQMLKRRFIRVLVPYNSTNYYITHNGRQQGLEYELLTNFEKYINKGVTDSSRKVHLIFHSVPFERLSPLLREGKGDIAAAGITVTSKREKKVAFTSPYINDVSEVIVMNKDSGPIPSKYDLSGKKVHVVSGSSFIGNLKNLNTELKNLGMSEIEIIEADPTLTDEDILDLVNARVYEYTVADSHVAELWQRVMDNISVQENAVISSGGSIAWAVRKDNPVLLAKLNEFLEKNSQGTLLGNILLNRYYFKRERINNPLSQSNRKNLNSNIEFFKRYGAEYDFDWLFLAAIAFQESNFDQNKKSSAGAVGIMQIKPSTAEDKNVGITGVEKSTEKNIHAATKYLDFLRSRYYSNNSINMPNQIYFTIAAYNAGPARINELRNLAEKFGKDPNQWFNHVEPIAMRKIGRETVDYVANINKYYMAYKSIQKTLQDKRESINPESEN